MVAWEQLSNGGVLWGQYFIQHNGGIYKLFHKSRLIARHENRRLLKVFAEIHKETRIPQCTNLSI